VNKGLNKSDTRGELWTKVYRRSEELVIRKIAGELFIVPVSGNLANMQRMFALTPVGECIWELFDGRRALSDLRNAVLDTYDVEKSQAESDIREFVAELLNAGLIREQKE
jgi:hypothetical protein